MTVLTDSRYAGLARTAAAALGASSPDVVRGILSQWQCEGQKQWPPARNNPGNIARGLAGDLGLAFTIGPNAPQPHNPIVTFASPEIGATAYAKAIATMSRYRAALAAARNGDGLGFVRAIGTSGWGTGLSCMTGVYRGKGAVGMGPNLPTGSGSSSGGSAGGSSSGIVLADYSACAAALNKLGISGQADHVISAGEAAAIIHSQNPNFKPGDYIYDSGVKQITGMKVSDYCKSNAINVLPGPLQDIQQAVRSFTDWSWVPGFAVNAGVIGVAAYLVLTGVRDILGDAPERAAIIAAE